MDCDTFTDSYGCVFTACNGYQSPFPLVRLCSTDDRAVPHLSDVLAVAVVPGAAPIAVKAVGKSGSSHGSVSSLSLTPGAGRLIRLELAAAGASASLLQALSAQHRPIPLEAPHSICANGEASAPALAAVSTAAAVFYKSLESEAGITSVATRSCYAWRALLFRDKEDVRVGDSQDEGGDCFIGTPPSSSCKVERAELDGVCSVSVAAPGTMWTLASFGGATSPVLRRYTSAASAFDPVLTASYAVPLDQLCDDAGEAAAAAVGTMTVAAVGEWEGVPTAAVFSPRGILLADARVHEPPVALHTSSAPGSINGGVAKDNVLVYSTGHCGGQLVAYDLRRTSSPLVSFSVPSMVTVRASARHSAVLLICGEQVGVLDTSSFTLLGAVESADGNVLDAVVWHTSASSVRMCVSSAGGMLYDWEMTHS